MVQFGILDCPVFLSWSLPTLLVVDAPITVISYVVASLGKTLSRSQLSRVEVH
jgi:hypothetical protein